MYGIKSRLTEKAFDELVKEEMENGSEGILLVYPEMYLEKKEGGYKKNNLLAVTDTMQSEFKYYAATLKSKKEQYRLLGRRCSAGAGEKWGKTIHLCRKYIQTWL